MPINKTTLSGQIYEILRSDILTRKIHMGEKLTLKMLQERFEVSSTPIREALTRLTEDGLVIYSSNIGVSVIEITEKDLKELYQFMGDLDSLSIIYSFSHPDYSTLCQKLKENIYVTDIERISTLDKTDVKKWISYSDRFHLLFYDYCNNDRLIRAAALLRSQLTIFSNMYESDYASQLSIYKEHTQICDAYCDGNPQLAAKLMKNHLMNSLSYAMKIFSQ